VSSCTASGCDRELPAGRVRYCSDACAWRAAKQRQRALRDREAAERAKVGWEQYRRFRPRLSWSRPVPSPTVAVEAYVELRDVRVAVCVGIVVFRRREGVPRRVSDDVAADVAEALRDDAKRFQMERYARRRRLKPPWREREVVRDQADRIA